MARQGAMWVVVLALAAVAAALAWTMMVPRPKAKEGLAAASAATPPPGCFWHYGAVHTNDRAGNLLLSTRTGPNNSRWASITVQTKDKSAAIYRAKPGSVWNLPVRRINDVRMLACDAKKAVNMNVDCEKNKDHPFCYFYVPAFSQ